MDNPFAGLLIVVGTLWDAFWPGLLGLVALAISTLFGLYVARDNSLAKHGLHGYNAHLVGCLVGRIAGCDDASMFGVLLVPTIIYALFSNVLFIALGNVLVPHFDVPCLTLPFNIACQFWIATMSMSPRFPGGPSASLPQVVVESVVPTYDLLRLLEAIPKGVGQVWLCDGTATGLIIWLGVFVCSPISAGFAGLGSIAGICCGVVIGAGEAALYDGIYGYNAVLGAIAVGAIFNHFNTSSIIAATSCAVLCTTAQFFVAANVSASGLGVMTLPFCIGTLPFLLIGNSLNGLTRVPVAEACTPEEVIIKSMRETRQRLKEELVAERREQGEVLQIQENVVSKPAPEEQV